MIRLDRVKAGYQTDGTTKIILENINLTINPGDRLGIIALMVQENQPSLNYWRKN